MSVANHILRRGSVEEGRHRESRLLLAMFAASQYEKLKINKLLEDTEKARFPERLMADKHVYDHNRERALEAIRGRQRAN